MAGGVDAGRERAGKCRGKGVTRRSDSSWPSMSFDLQTLHTCTHTRTRTHTHSRTNTLTHTLTRLASFLLHIQT